MKKIASLLLSSSMLFTLCSPINIVALELADEKNDFNYETSNVDTTQDEKELINAAIDWSEGLNVEFRVNGNITAYFKDFDTAWQAVVVDKKFMLDNDPSLIVGEESKDFPLPDELKFVMSEAQTVTKENLTVEDGVTVNIVVAPSTNGGAARPQDIAHTFNSGITVKSGGSLKFGPDYMAMYPNNVTVTFGGAIKVEDGGSLTMESVDPSSETKATVYQLKAEATGSLLEVAEGGNATLTDVKLTSSNDKPVISTAGNVVLSKSGLYSKTTEVSNSGNAPAIEVKENAKLTVNSAENGNGALSISSSGQSQPAIKVENNASLSLPKNSDAAITSSNNGGKAVDLAKGSKVDIAGTEVTVGTDGENYVGNDGIAFLDVGATNNKNESLNHAVLLPDGTIVQGTANKKPTVDTNEDGSIKVTVPDGGSVTDSSGNTTNMPNGGNVSTDGNDTTVTPETVPSGGGGGGSTQKLNKVYRAYNPNNGEHLYTLDEKEFKHVIGLGWHDEGVAFMAETEKNGKPLYRVYNPNSGLHHYTLNENEKNTLVSLGWHDEKVAWYTSNKPQSAPVYRVYNQNDGQHHYTVDGHEKDVLVSLGWTYEGIAFRTAPIETK